MKLSKKKIIRYFSADIAKGFFTGMIANYLLYFFQPTMQSGLPSLLPDNKLFGFFTIIAILTAISKVVDAITDPIVANISDKCTSKYGRRMPFLRIGAFPYALCVLMVFYAPFVEGSVGNAIWVGFFLIAYYVFYTIYSIPHRALIPEIIPDEKERVSYFAISTVFFMGSSALMYTVTLFVNLLKNAGISPLWSWRIIFTVFAFVGCFFLFNAAFAFREKDYVKGTNLPEDSFLKSFLIVLKNKDFVIFTIGDFFSYVSMAFFQTTLLYYITDLLNVPEKNAFIVMITSIVTAISLFPLIVFLSKKKNKKLPLLIGTWIFTGVFIAIFFGDIVARYFAGKELLLGVMMGIFVSFPFAAVNILPQSIVADIIQADSIRTGKNREGFYSAVKTFLEKIGYALAMMIVSSVLAIGANEGSKVGLMGIKLTGIFAGGFSLISATFFHLYNDKRVTEFIKKHRNGKEDLEEPN